MMDANVKASGAAIREREMGRQPDPLPDHRSPIERVRDGDLDAADLSTAELLQYRKELECNDVNGLEIVLYDRLAAAVSQVNAAKREANEARLELSQLRADLSKLVFQGSEGR